VTVTDGCKFDVPAATEISDAETKTLVIMDEEAVEEVGRVC